ncbi:general transcription factor 3C polypeptide 5 [Danaus plexippus]|uniref:general transcription factor 3C polypeptide 5 n=1 Tax=Danaus plexippus TaxID=13037 RepID=UPI002AB2F810|nr:general transcription factor 3C polypeptide 5 [Danaus plexippus]
MENNDNLRKELYCVLFPGVVKNDEKAIQCMGGIKALSQHYTQANKKRLGFSFQPDNPFMKKIYADAKPTAGVLFKLKVKKTKSGNEVKKEVISTSIVGTVKKINRFESMCDFQYLPLSTPHREGDKPQCLIEQIIPSGLDELNSILEPTPLFITPSNFTRSDKPITYCYTEKRYVTKDMMKGESTNDEVHKTRMERSLHLPRFIFSLNEELPTEPNEYYIKLRNARQALNPSLEEEYNTVAKLFEERPIWSLNLVKFHTKIKLSSLKVIMPCLALYMREGPWRMLWTRFGYDPRKEPGSRIYQTLDFRMRHAAGVHSMVSTRDEFVHCKKKDRIKNLSKSAIDDLSIEDTVYEGAVYFRPGMAPTQRQIYYQYCDVYLPEVQELVSLSPPAGYTCHERRGWLPPDTDQLCRDHIFRYVMQTLLANRVKYEDGVGTGGESSSDDADEAANASVAEVDESINT